MAVPKNKRSKGQLEVFTLSKNLVSHSIRMCSNEKVLPKKFRYSLGDEIVRRAFNVALEIETANSIHVKTELDFADRHAAQNRAIANANALLVALSVLYEEFHMNEKKATHWTGLTVDVRDLLRSWKNKDSQRYSDELKNNE